MGYAEYENYYINEEGLKLVLAGIGVESLYGFSKTEDQDEVTKEDVNKLLAYLYQEGYVTWEEGNIRLLEPLNSLAEILVKAVNCIMIEREESSKVCYCGGDKVLVTEWGNQDQDKLRFSIWESPEFMESLWDAEVFPEEELDDAPDLKEEVHNIQTVFTLADKKTGQTKCIMKVFEEGIFTYISITEDTEESISLYNREQMENILGNWFRMEVQK